MSDEELRFARIEKGLDHLEGQIKALALAGLMQSKTNRELIAITGHLKERVGELERKVNQ